MSTVFKIIGVAFGVLIILGGYLNYLFIKSEEIGTLRHEAKKEFLTEISSSWTFSKLEQLLGRNAVEKDFARYTKLLQFGRTLGSFQSCQRVFLAFRKEELEYAKINFTEVDCSFSRGTARVILGAPTNNQSTQVVYFDLKKSITKPGTATARSAG